MGADLTSKKLNFLELGVITLVSNGVLVSGRYGHGKPRKPVNSPLSALHRFQSYIISVCF